MQNKFIQFIRHHKLFLPGDKILLGVSGGMDSVAMCRLFNISGFNFAVAHCNFALRGDESEEDEIFVKQLAADYGVEFFSMRFKTEKAAEALKVSIQMAARKLRYDWFEKIRSEYGFKYISVAHHADDDLETFFINFLRGTGIAGLAGINPKNGYLIRPLLFASRSEIEKFSHTEKLVYREDSSNLSEKYLRNKLRNTVLPLLREINPSITDTAKAEIQRLKNTYQIFRQAIEEKRRQLFFFSSNGESCSIYIEELKKLKPLETWLYQFLSPYGFNIESVIEIVSSFGSIPGKKFYSNTHQVIKDRDLLIVSPLSKTKKEEAIKITVDTKKIESPFELEFARLIREKNFKIPPVPAIACLDIEKIEFPLEIRKWEKGDKFIPLGMKGFKKVSDFLIDMKVPLTEKEKVYIMKSGKNIAWIIGYRIDNRFKISDKTREILRAEIVKQA